MTVYLFPGQGTQYPGMGFGLYQSHPPARRLFDQADKILGFSLTNVMFDGSAQRLLATQVAQPAIFLYSLAQTTLQTPFAPDAVAGHSLGELSALVAAGALSFEEGLWLVQQRAEAMQVACARHPGAMAAVLGLEDAVVERICRSVEEESVTPANYNAPNQVVISGTPKGVCKASEALEQAGAKKIVPLQVEGAFHSQLMQVAQQKMQRAVEQVQFRTPKCPVYQNVSSLAETSPEQMRANLVAQITAPVRWTTLVQNMVHDGARRFVACGPGHMLRGLVRRITTDVEITDLSKDSVSALCRPRSSE